MCVDAVYQGESSPITKNVTAKQIHCRLDRIHSQQVSAVPRIDHSNGVRAVERIDCKAGLGQ